MWPVLASMVGYEIRQGDALELLREPPTEHLQCGITSPPYWGLRDYGVQGQLGCESTPDEYVAKLFSIFRELRRVLRADETLWLNLGDTYFSQSKSDLHYGLKRKDLVGIPWMVAFALRADGWYLRQGIIWHKPNAMPESAKDRCTKAHEYVFLLSKSEKYYYDAAAIEEPAKWKRWGDQTEKKKHPGTAGHLGGKTLGQLPIRDKKNRRSVWSIPTKPYKGAHFAVFPEALVEPCILAGSRPGDTVADPFAGSATTGVVALRHGRKFIGLELNPDYIKLAHERIGREILRTGDKSRRAHG